MKYAIALLVLAGCGGDPVGADVDAGATCAPPAGFYAATWTQVSGNCTNTVPQFVVNLDTHPHPVAGRFAEGCTGTVARPAACRFDVEEDCPPSKYFSRSFTSSSVTWTPDGASASGIVTTIDSDCQGTYRVEYRRQ